MPKILSNMRDRIIAEARKQTEVGGYTGLTMRSVAEQCHIGLGTVYNYFPSKDLLIATYVLEDWKETLKQMQSYSGNALGHCEVIFSSLHDFRESHRPLFSDKSVSEGFNAARNHWHETLCKQIAELLLPSVGDPFTSEFLATVLVEWSGKNTPFSAISQILNKIIK